MSQVQLPAVVHWAVRVVNELAFLRGILLHGELAAQRQCLTSSCGEWQLGSCAAAACVP